MILATIGKEAEFYVEQKLNPNKTLAIFGDQQRVGRIASKEIEALPELGGISGCGVWHVRNLLHADTQYELVGILTGENESKTVFYATKIDQVRHILVYQFQVEGI